MTLDPTQPTPAVLAWCRDHGLDPNQIAKHGIRIDSNGLVHLRRYLLRDGKHFVVNGDVAWEPITVRPKYPFP